MATLDQLAVALKNADAAGDGDAARQLAGAIQQMRARRPVLQDDTDYSPTAGMSTFDRLAAGAGMGMTNVARGIGQLLPGGPSQSDIEKSRRLDSALANTTAGKVGNVIGTATLLAPTAFIPGANTLAGAAAIGGITGAVATPGDVMDRAKAAGMGAVAAPLGIAAGRTVAAGAGAVKSLVAPLFKSGQDELAANVMQQFAGNPQAMRDALEEIAARSVKPSLTGTQPTTAELTSNAGIHQLERTLRQNPDYGQLFNQRLSANREALKETLSSVAGDEGALSAATATRAAKAAPAYESALSANVKADKNLATLLKRPSMEEALARATKLADEDGAALTVNKKLTGRGLHYLKMAMDDMLGSPATSGIGKNEARAIGSTRDQLVEWMTKKLPGYADATKQYADLSRPINQMQVGQALEQKLAPALADFGSERMTPNAFASAMRNADQTAKTATGFKGATMGSVMEPQQMAQLRGIAQDLADRSNVELTRTSGSPTMQNMLADNMVRQTLGPLGLPRGWLDVAARSAAGRLIGSPAQAANKILGGEIESGVKDRLVRALLDPAEAQRLLPMLSKETQSKLLQVLTGSQRYMPAVGSGLAEPAQ